MLTNEFGAALVYRDLQTMRARGVAPDEITYSSAITACGNSGEAGEALALLKVLTTLSP